MKRRAFLGLADLASVLPFFGQHEAPPTEVPPQTNTIEPTTYTLGSAHALRLPSGNRLMGSGSYTAMFDRAVHCPFDDYRVTLLDSDDGA